MHFPPSLKEVNEMKEVPGKISLNNGENKINFMKKLKYLKSIIQHVLYLRLKLKQGSQKPMLKWESSKASSPVNTWTKL